MQVPKFSQNLHTHTFTLSTGGYVKQLVCQKCNKKCIIFKLFWIYTESSEHWVYSYSTSNFVNVIFSTYTLHRQQEQTLAALLAVPTCPPSTPFLALAAVSAWQAYIK